MASGQSNGADKGGGGWRSYFSGDTKTRWRGHVIAREGEVWNVKVTHRDVKDQDKIIRDG